MTFPPRPVRLVLDELSRREFLPVIRRIVRVATETIPATLGGR